MYLIQGWLIKRCHFPVGKNPDNCWQVKKYTCMLFVNCVWQVKTVYTKERAFDRKGKITQNRINWWLFFFLSNSVLREKLALWEEAWLMKFNVAKCHSMRVTKHPPHKQIVRGYLLHNQVLKKVWLCWGLTTRQPLRVILCRLPEKGRKEIEEEMKRRDEREGQGRKRKRSESEEIEEIKKFPPLPLPVTRIAGLAQL